jgi:flagellum-specific peptidoglycan hydrolase FlgJ
LLIPTKLFQGIPTNKFMTKQEFVSAATAAAQKSSAVSGFPASVAVAQAALESAWGASRLSQKANNFFGIKAHAGCDSIAMPTTECSLDAAGQTVTKRITARFARYGSIDECFADRDRIIRELACYAEARLHAGEPIAFIHSLAKHWATDPAYAEKLEQIYLQNNFATLDSAY